MSFLKSIRLGSKTMTVFSDDDSQQLITREEFNDELGSKQNKLIQENGIIIDPDSDEIFIDLTKFKGIVFGETPVAPTDEEKQTLYINDNKWYKWDSGEDDWVIVGEGEISDDYKKILFTAPPATASAEQKKNLYISDNKWYKWDTTDEEWVIIGGDSLKYVKDYDEDPGNPNKGVVLGDVDNNHASGEYSVAEGRNTTASGEASHTEGLGTIAAKDNQHAQGMYNIEDIATGNTGKYAHIVGNGTADNARSNAHTLDWDGNAWYAGKVTAGADPTADMDLVTKRFLVTQLANLGHAKMKEVDTLPTTGQETNVFYLVPKIGGGYEMYLWDEDDAVWVDLGPEQVDLSAYLKSADAETIYLKLADAVTTYLKIADAETTYQKKLTPGTATNLDTSTNTISVRANSASDPGYVAAGTGNNKKVWKTNESGEPAWRDEAPDYVVDSTSTAVTLAAKKDTVYKYGTLTSLNVTSIEGGIVSIIFTSGATATTVTLPSGVTIPSDYAIEANKTYELNIMQGLLLMGVW